ncbi:BnaCnng21920D [Brassica napus]|uniref:BnaCnng21920D protein n=1 Tax=Brassica napus TaxID=3708 RepID=A0A078IQ90_BRANA|nr:BnaCnng21920D [Brassica napus]
MGVDMLVLDSKREIFDDLASLLWHSVGTVPALLQLSGTFTW